MPIIKFINGRAGYGKTARLWQHLKEDIATKRAERYIVLVPEQFSFCAEKSLTEFLDNKLSVNVEVASFKKLVREVLTNSCYKEKEIITANMKNAIVLLLMNEVKPFLKYYKNCENNSGLAQSVTRIIKKLKIGMISEDLLKKVIQKQTGKLKSKIEDIYIIYSKYNSLIKDELQDEDDELGLACLYLKHKNIFENTNFYIDAFYSLSENEFRFLSTFLKASNFFWAIELSKEENETDVFFYSRNMQTTLKALAETQKIEVKTETLTTQLRFKTPELKHLEGNILKFQPQKYKKPINNLQLVKADNRYEEIEYVAITIIKLIKEQKFRFKDILVVARNISNYSHIIKSVFKKYEIEYFESNIKQIRNNVLIKLIHSLISVLQTNFETNAVFSLLKNPLLNISIQDLSDLEQYCNLAAINTKDWYKEFKTTSFLIGCEKSEAENKLCNLNNIRKQFIQPLIDFKKNKKMNQKAIELARMIYEYIENTEIKQNLENQAENSKIQEENFRSWEKFVNILDEFILCGKFINKDSLDLNLSLIKIYLENCNFNSEFQGLDQVLVGTADKIRPFNPRAVFIIGADTENFPFLNLEESGIFISTEIEQLKTTELKTLFSKCTTQDSKTYDIKTEIINNEKLLIYNSLTAASDKVFISFTKSSTKDNNSIIAESLQNIFENLSCQTVKSILKNADFICNKQTAIDALCQSYDTNTNFGKALIKFFEEKNFLGDKQIKSILRRNSFKDDFKITDPDLLESLKTRKWKISPTNLEDFKKCKFKYFCKELLKLKAPPNSKIEKNDLGSILHNVLRYIFSRYFKNNYKLTENFQISEKAKQWLIKDFSDQNKAENLISDAVNCSKGKINFSSFKASREQYIYSRIKEIALKTVYEAIEELKYSKFIPFVFEIQCDKKFNYRNFDIILTGNIDRVNLLKLNGCLWLEIIDYKSGKKSFSLNDIYNGISLQTLFYMNLLLNSQNLKLDIKPAGALYMPIRNETLNLEFNDFVVESKSTKPPKMYGAVTDNIEILQSMEQNLNKKIVPANLNKSGKLRKSFNIFDAKKFQLIFKYIKYLIKLQFDLITEGDFEPIPLEFNEYDICKSCEFRSICKFGDEEKCKRILIEEDEFWKVLENLS